MNLLDAVMNAQNGDVLRQLASNLQLDEGQARSAVGALVPAMGRGISNNASSPEGLDDLIGALSRGKHSRYIEQPAALGGSTAIDEGNGILGHIFGSKDVSRNVAAQAAAETGIDAGLIKQALPLVAGIAMGALSKRRESSLTDLLGGNGDGFGVDDVLGLAKRFF